MDTNNTLPVSLTGSIPLGAEKEALHLREALEEAQRLAMNRDLATVNAEQARNEFTRALEALRVKGAVVELVYDEIPILQPEEEENPRATGYESPKKCTKRHKAYVYAHLPKFFRQLCAGVQGKGVPKFNTDMLLAFVRDLATSDRWRTKAGPPPELETADGKARWALWFREVLDSNLPRTRARVRKARHYRLYEYNKGNTFLSRPYEGGYDDCCDFIETSSQTTLPLD